MTDRDTFAAAALTGLCSMPPMSGPDKPHDFAAMAYAYADAMLRERAKTNHDAAPERGDALAYDEAAARLLYERDSANDELSLLRRAVRQLLDGVNERHPEKPPREWVCNDMALLDRLVPPNHDASPEAIAPEPEPSAVRRRPAGGTGDTDHGAAPAARASVGRPRTDNADLPTCAGTGDTPEIAAYRRFVGEVMNWISEATGFMHDDVLRTDDARDIITDACSRCWDAFDRIAYPTVHGASPEARASVDSVAPQPTTRGESDRNDKAAPRPSEGTGDTPDSPKPIKGGVSDRSKPINGPDPDSRVWETPVHTPATHATPSVGSVPRDGTEPVAWGVANGSRVLATSISRMDAVDMQGDYAYHTEIVPLYREPTLTDEESDDLRMWFAECMDQSTAATDRANEELSARWLLRAHRASVMLDRLGGWR